MSLNQNAELAAVSLFDGSLKISTINGETKYDIRDEDMVTPITNLSWKPNREGAVKDQHLLGACLNGSIMRWTRSMRNSVEHITLNENNSYHAIDCSDKIRRFCVAGSQPYIEIYDEARMTLIQ